MQVERWTKMVAAAGFSLAVLGSFSPARAAEANPAIDQRAASILKAALQNVAASKSFTFSAEVIKEVPIDSGQRIQDISVLKTFVRRPNGLTAIREGGATGDGDMYYDGKLFALLNRKANVYGTWDAPATIDELFDKMKEKLGFVPPLAAILRADAGSGARQKEILSGTYVGRATLRGVDCHHLAFTAAEADLEVWVDEGIPLIRRFVVTYKKKAGAPQFTVTFLNWDLNAVLSDYLFTFAPPPDARKIEFKVVAKP